jgi:hypothetical protein
MGRYDYGDDDADTGTVSVLDKDDTRDEGSDVDLVKARRLIKRGWGNAEQARSANSPFAERLKFAEEPVLIKFLEDEPYTSYHQHWIDRKQGQRSFTCIADINPKGCPLCDAGDRPSLRTAFNVALLIDGEWLVKSYEVGPRVFDSLKNFHQDRRMGPLSRHYWAVSKSGKGGTSQTNHQMVKADDLEDMWDADPISDAAMAKLKEKVYDESIVRIPNYNTLKQLVAEEFGDV